jgi:hypothetical protein
MLPSMPFVMTKSRLLRQVNGVLLKRATGKSFTIQIDLFGETEVNWCPGLGTVWQMTKS